MVLTEPFLCTFSHWRRWLWGILEPIRVKWRRVMHVRRFLPGKFAANTYTFTLYLGKERQTTIWSSKRLQWWSSLTTLGDCTADHSITSYLFPAILQIHWPRDREQGLFTAGTFSPWPICWAGKCLKSADHTSAGGDCSRVHPPCIFTPLSPGAITMVAVPRCVTLRRVCVYRDRLTQSGVNCSLPSISWPLVGARRLSLWARWGLLQTTYSTHRISIRTSASRPGCVGFERRSILSLKRVVAKTQTITFSRKYKDSYYAPVQP